VARWAHLKTKQEGEKERIGGKACDRPELGATFKGKRGILSGGKGSKKWKGVILALWGLLNDVKFGKKQTERNDKKSRERGWKA